MLRIKVLFFVCAATLFSCASGSADSSPGKLPESITLTADQLKDKIKGGWAGQTIGVTYGGPTEFRYNGTFIQNY